MKGLQMSYAGPITRTILLDNVKAARKALERWEVDTDSSEVIDMYDSMLDDCYPEASIAGMTYSTSHALKEVDPTAYRCGMNDWADGLDKEEFEDYRELQEALESAESELEAFDDDKDTEGGAL